MLLGVLILVSFVSGQFFEVAEELGRLREWIATRGVIGYLGFIAIYISAAVLAFPGAVLTLSAGVLFDPLLGVILVSIGSTTGACLAFLIARYFARNAVSVWLSGNQKFHRLDALTQQYGALIVTLTRLVPIIPYNILNYGLGLTRVRFLSYVFWSWLGMLPVTTIYVLSADAVFEGMSGKPLSPSVIAVLAGAGTIVVVAAWWGRRVFLTARDSQSAASRYPIPQKSLTPEEQSDKGQSGD